MIHTDGPCPSHVLTRRATRAPAIPPADQAEKNSPMIAADRCRFRASSTSDNDKPAELKKFDVPVVRKFATSNRLPKTSRTPSPISRTMLRSAARSGLAGRSRMAATQLADQRKLTASMSTAYGAVTRWMSRPPTDGPATWAIDWLACNLALPSTSRSRPTSSGR